MLILRKSEDRGHADHGWLKTRYSFSFSDYYDPRHMGFRSLRVINQDIVAPGQGFPTHGHRDMEIITVILRGQIEHKDSMGNTKLIPAGDVQRMSAGTGVQHSEYNPSKEQELELLQIWIEPELRGIPPSYEQATIPLTPQALTLLVAPEGQGAPIKIHQNARLYRGHIGSGSKIDYPLPSGRYAWIQQIEGRLRVNGQELQAGDGLAVSREERLELEGLATSSFLLFDLA
jgi:redox-sensitive bicupin YhaK (pirin superfamily)